MTLIQKRIPELDVYTQLAVGAVGYIDPATIHVAVDKTGWAEAKRMSIVDFLSLNHIETAAISPSSVSVSVTYDSPFVSSNYYFARLQVYKTVTIPGVGDVQSTIPYHDLAKTVNGFSLTLSEYTDVTIVYYASEPATTSLTTKDFMYATGAVASLVVPDSDKVQITGFTEAESQGITLASDEFTVAKGGNYSIEISGATLSETASNLISVDVYSDVPTALGITKNFIPRNDYDQFGVVGIIPLDENDVVRFYLTAAATGLTVDLSSVTVNIRQV